MWILFTLLAAIQFAQSQDLEYRRVKLLEHPKPDTEVLKVYTNNLNSNIRKTAIIEAIDEKYKQFFYIDKLDGGLKTSGDCQQSLDREKICQANEECMINILILINNSEILTVEVVIVDINDNRPLFDSGSYQEVSIREQRLFNQYLYVMLDPAKDQDSEINAKIKYSLQFRDPHKAPFDVMTNETGLFLVVKRDLDFEKINLYKMILNACDEPKSCTQQDLYVKVENFNEFPPRFEKESYQVSIKDSHPLESDIIKLNYIDYDAGDYGRVKFSLVRDSGSEEILSHFKIDEITGIMHLAKPLTEPGRYNIRVKVEDSFHENYTSIVNPIPKSFSVECLLVVSVVDTNNFAPEIEIRKASSEEGDLFRNSPILWVTENSKPPINVGYVTVVDRDSGNNAKVECHLVPDKDLEDRLDPEAFKVTFSNSIDEQTSVFKIVMNKYLNAEEIFLEKKLERGVDYEKLSKKNIAGFIKMGLNCSDFGEPRNWNIGNVLIGLLDQDEFPKSFIHNNKAPIVVSENVMDIVISHVSIYDKDIAPETVYRLLNDSSLAYDQVPAKDSSFSIDETNGNISIRKSLDAELISEIYLTIGAKERYDAQFEEITRVLKIIVLDLNDNNPEFTMPPITKKVYGKKYDGIREISFTENQPIDTFITRIEAKDADIDQKHRDLEFFIEKTTPFYAAGYQNNLSSNNWPMFRKNFRIKDGYLKSNFSFDAEEIEKFEVMIGVRDGGNPQLTSYTLITVRIADVNDEHPAWKFPRQGDNKVEFDRSTHEGSIVTRVNAIDLDSSKEFSKVYYSIPKSEFNEFFEIDEGTGDVFLKKSIKNIKEKEITLRVKACDGVLRNVCEENTLNINLVESNFIQSQSSVKKFRIFNNSLDGMQNLLALSGGILGGLLFTAILIGVLLLFICKKRKLNFLPTPEEKDDKYFQYKIASSKILDPTSIGQLSGANLYSSWLRDTSHQTPSIYQTTPRSPQKHPGNYTCTPNSHNRNTPFSDSNSQGSTHENPTSNAQIITAPQEFYYIQQPTTPANTNSPPGLNLTDQYFVYPNNVHYTSFEDPSSYQKIVSIPPTHYVQ